MCPLPTKLKTRCLQGWEFLGSSLHRGHHCSFPKPLVDCWLWILDKATLIPAFPCMMVSEIEMQTSWLSSTERQGLSQGNWLLITLTNRVQRDWCSGLLRLSNKSSCSSFLVYCNSLSWISQQPRTVCDYSQGSNVERPSVATSLTTSSLSHVPCHHHQGAQKGLNG